MKPKFISSRRMAVVNGILSSSAAIAFTIFTNNFESQVFLIAISIANIGFIFLSKFYWNQYDNGMPCNPDVSADIALFFEIALRYVPLLVKYCVIAIILTSLYENDYSNLGYIIIISIIVLLFFIETICFFINNKNHI